MDKNSKISLSTGSSIPIIGLGTWLLNTNTTATILRALDIGYRFIDTSGDYGTQKNIGEALRKTHIEREEIFIQTKVEENEKSYAAVTHNLKEIGIDYADAILIHRPPLYGAGEELWEGLIKARKEGLVKNIGVSNYSIGLIEELIEKTGEVPAINQIEWSPFGFTKQMLDYCKSKNIIIQAYSPLTRGRRLEDENLKIIADSYHKTPAQILLRWSIQKGTIPIPKANQKSHLEENINIFDFEINNEDMQRLDNLCELYSSLGTLSYI